MKRIRIKSIMPTFSWKWSLNQSTNMCCICQQEFEQMCFECNHPTSCVPCIGNCKHIFHFHCISAWMETNKLCPMCRKPFTIKKKYKCCSVD
ncbi:hypothetical protein SLOPH_2594 [Spraguea lophii 42_110]|uniref:RING-type domain-containing protein n=1 Tax=Spraguea lophii (strain 42_110) TaxID=1358809 RepID=S7W4V6_SPRLO|nr:hypothetical protein SLOPH_2594 [Spraguea lophii 42_110]